jgi:hypothetical protein
MRILAAARNYALLVLALVFFGGVILQPGRREASVPQSPVQIAQR